MRETIVKEHPLREVILSALVTARSRQDDTALALSAAVKAVLDARPTMTIAEAYELVNELWVQ